MSKRCKLDAKIEEAKQFEVYTFCQGRYGCLYHDSHNNELVPRRIEDFNPKFDMKTFKLLQNGVSIIFDFESRIYSFGSNRYGCGGLGEVTDEMDKPNN